MSNGPACTSTTGVNCGGGDFCYNATWTVRGDDISFEIRARTTGWAGIGFSSDQMMVMDNNSIFNIYISTSSIKMGEYISWM